MNAFASGKPYQTSTTDETFIKHIKKQSFSPGSCDWQVLKTQGVPIIPAWFNLLSKKQIQQPLIFKDDREEPLRQPNASFCITRLLQRRADGWSSLRVPAIEAAQFCVKLQQHRRVHMASGRRDPKFSCAAARWDHPAHTHTEETLVLLHWSQKEPVTETAERDTKYPASKGPFTSSTLLHPTFWSILIHLCESFLFRTSTGQRQQKIRCTSNESYVTTTK